MTAMFPMPPNVIDPSFYLLSRDGINRTEFKYNFNESEFKESNFDPEIMTVVMVHGFYQSVEDWMLVLNELLFNSQNIRILFICFSNLTQISIYFNFCTESQENNENK